MSFPRYPEYKDSGVEWLGEVPVHWRVTRLGFECETVVPMRDKPTSLDGPIPWIRIEDFDGRYLQGSKTSQGVSLDTIASMSLKVLPVGAVLCSCSCSMGATAIVAQPLVTNQTFIGVIPGDGVVSEFLYFFFTASSDFLDSIGTGAIQTYLSQSDFRSLRIGLPPMTEQHAIASFLDQETAKIDELVAEQVKLIALLKEKRQAVISHAVTKGLNPDTPMKDSGIEWLGEVPGNWSLKRIKHIKSQSPNAFVDGPFGSNLKSEHFVDDGDVYVVESNFATQNSINPAELKTITFVHFETVSRSEVRAGDIVIAKIGAQFGKASILPELDKRSLVSGNSLKLTVDNNVCDTRWAHLQLVFLKRSGQIDLLANGSAQPALSLGGMNNLPFLLPPLGEQLEIMDFIEQESVVLEGLTREAMNSIALLKERRAALISAAVTGKIDVRNYAAQREAA